MCTHTGESKLFPEEERRVFGAEPGRGITGMGSSRAWVGNEAEVGLMFCSEFECIDTATLTGCTERWKESKREYGILRPGCPERMVYLNWNYTYKHQMRRVQLQKAAWDARMCFAWQQLLVRAWDKENHCFAPNMMWWVMMSEHGRRLCARAIQSISPSDFPSFLE